MNQNARVIATVLSAGIVIVVTITFGLKMKEEKEKSFTNKNSSKNHVVEIKNTCGEGGTFPDAIEEYYQDDEYICTFNQIKSGCYVVEVDGKEYSLKTALTDKVITVEEAISKGMDCRKKSSSDKPPVSTNSNSSSNNHNSSNTNSNNDGNSSVNSNNNTNSNSSLNTNISSSNSTGNKNSNSSSNINTNTNSNRPSNIISNSNNQNKISIVDKCGPHLTQQIDEFYQDSQYIYYFTTGKSNCIYVNVKGKEYPLKNALNNKIVTMSELEKVGFKCLKKSKNLVGK